MPVSEKEVKETIAGDSQQPDSTATDSSEPSVDPKSGIPANLLPQALDNKRTFSDNMAPGVMQARGAASPTNAAAAPAPGTFSGGMGPGIMQPPAPGSFAAKWGLATKSLTNLGMPFVNAMALAGVHAMDPKAPSNTTWDQAQSNADQTPESQGLQMPSRADQVRRGAAGILGDISAGAGGRTGLEGINRAANAVTSRQQADFDNNVKMAKANAEMLHEQQLLHRTSEEAVEASAKQGAQSASVMMLAPKSEVLAKDITSDEVQKLMQSGQIDPSKHAMFLTGRKLIGNDANGQPQFRSTYTVIKPGEKITLDDETKRDFINTYTHNDFDKGTELTSQDYYRLDQLASTNFANELRRQEGLDLIEAKDYDVHLKKGDADFFNSKPWQAAVNSVPHTGAEDPYLEIKAYIALERMASHNDYVGQGQLPKDWHEQAKHAIGGGGTKYAENFEKLMDKYSVTALKDQEAGAGGVRDIVKKLDSAPSINEVISLQGAIERKIADPTTPQDQIDPLKNLGSQAERTMSRMQAEKERQERLDNSIKTGSPEAAGQMLADRNALPADLRTRGMTEDFIVKALAEADRIRQARGQGHYNAPNEEHLAKAVGTAHTTDFFRNVGSLIGEDGTLEQLDAAAQKISKHDFQILNSWTNWSKEAAGDKGISGYAATLVGVVDDYAKVMGGGGGSDSSRQLVLDIAQNKLSPQQRKEAIHNMQHAVFSQGISELAANPWLAMTYARDLEYAAKKLGVKMPDIVSTTFNDANGPQAHTDAVNKARQVRSNVTGGAIPNAVNITPDMAARAPKGSTVIPGAGIVVQTPVGPHIFPNQAAVDVYNQKVAEAKKAAEAKKKLGIQ